jgi:hypothetical protein
MAGALCSMCLTVGGHSWWCSSGAPAGDEAPAATLGDVASRLDAIERKLDALTALWSGQAIVVGHVHTLHDVVVSNGSSGFGFHTPQPDVAQPEVAQPVVAEAYCTWCGRHGHTIHDSCDAHAQPQIAAGAPGRGNWRPPQPEVASGGIDHDDAKALQRMAEGRTVELTEGAETFKQATAWPEDASKASESSQGYYGCTFCNHIGTHSPTCIHAGLDQKVESIRTQTKQRKRRWWRPL